MEETESGKFIDWIHSLTITDAMNIVLMGIFGVFILILVLRTLRNKPSA